MKKFLSVILAWLLSMTTSMAFADEVNVISREEGSGTRGAFIELFGIEQKNEEGVKIDCTTDDCDITNSTSVMMTSVAGNDCAIGYISLGSMNETVKALLIDGVQASVENIKNGSYKVAGPFNIATGMRREEVLGLGWENIHLDENYGEVKRVVVFPNNAKAVVKDSPKTETSERTFIIPAALKQILLPHQKAGGYVIHGEGEYSPVSYSTFQRTYYGAFKTLGIYGKYSNHDWRSTFGSQLKEQGMSSALVADLLGHADTRMVETTYARTRHEGVMKQRQAVENLNAFL